MEEYEQNRPQPEAALTPADAPAAGQPAAQPDAAEAAAETRNTAQPEAAEAAETAADVEEAADAPEQTPASGKAASKKCGKPQTVEVVDVRFRNNAKTYFFDPDGLTLQAGDHVVLETARGDEFAVCACVGSSRSASFSR